MRHLIPLAAATVLLASCASKQSLEPRPGQALPATPYGADYPPTSEDLLEPPVLALPERDIELRTRSEEREDDPFDLPPE